MYPGEHGVGTRKAFPASAKQKERISMADDAPEVNTNCDGSKETEFLVASDMNPATACTQSRKLLSRTHKNISRRLKIVPNIPKSRSNKSRDLLHEHKLRKKLKSLGVRENREQTIFSSISP